MNRYKTFHFRVYVAIILLFGSCTNRDVIQISGIFTKNDPTPVKLYRLTEEESVLIDSVYTENTDFKLSAESDHSSLYVLKFFNDQSVYLILHPGDNIKLEINNSNPELSYYVEGSFDSKRIKELTDQQKIVLRKIDVLSNQWDQNKSDTIMRNKIDSAYNAIFKEYRTYTQNFIKENPRSLANILALYQNLGSTSQQLFDPYDDLELFNFVDSNLTVLYPQTEGVIALNREVTEIKNQISRNQLLNKQLSIGSPLPELITEDIYGDTVKLPSQDQRPAVLLFWASFNPISVSELLELNTFAKTSRGHQIDIVTVSLDTSKDNLLHFLEKEGIELTVVCDFQYWDSPINSKYVVKKIPYTIVTNKYGFISEMDIYNNNLKEKINQVLSE